MGDGQDVTVSVEEVGYDDAPTPVAEPAPPPQKAAAAEPATGGGSQGGGSGGGIFRILLLSFRSTEVICCLIAFRCVAPRGSAEGPL